MGEVEREVEFGLERFATERKVEIALWDALFVFKVLGEFIAFFHQPEHWKSLAQVEGFIGTWTKADFTFSARPTTAVFATSGQMTCKRRSTMDIWIEIPLSKAGPANPDSAIIRSVFQLANKHRPTEL